MQIGTSVATPIEKRPWNRIIRNINGTLTQIPKNKKNIPYQIVHKIFADMSEITTDLFWKNLFHQCAYDKFPRLVSFKEDTLYFKNKKKIESTILAMDHLELAIEQAKNFLKQKKGLSGDKDEEENKMKLNIKEEVYEKWSKVNRKKVKDSFVFAYLLKLKERHQLSNLEFLQLQTLTVLGFTLGNCNCMNIIIKNNEIETIQGLIFDETIRKFYFDNKSIKKPKSSGKKKSSVCDRSVHSMQKIKKVNFLKRWKKYIETLSKNIVTQVEEDEMTSVTHEMTTETETNT
jgi:hypothetical protein